MKYIDTHFLWKICRNSDDFKTYFELGKLVLTILLEGQLGFFYWRNVFENLKTLCSSVTIKKKKVLSRNTEKLDKFKYFKINSNFLENIIDWIKLKNKIANNDWCFKINMLLL